MSNKYFLFYFIIIANVSNRSIFNLVSVDKIIKNTPKKTMYPEKNPRLPSSPKPSLIICS